MFTGIVEEIGRIKNVQRGAKSITFCIEASKVLADTEIGDSICTNGVCLTVTDISPAAEGKGWFKADVMPETIRKTSMAKLQVGSKVNLERALTLNTRLGGHIVSGHVDGIGHVVRKEQDDIAIWLWIECDANLMRYIIPKGSVTLQGVSLTVKGRGNTLCCQPYPSYTREDNLARKRGRRCCQYRNRYNSKVCRETDGDE